MAPILLELALPETLGLADAVELLGRHLTIEPGRARSEDRVFVDSFDGRLRAAGLLAERTRKGQLRVNEPGAPPRTADAAVFAADLPPGPLRERLEPVLEGRALLSLVRVRSRLQALAVLNHDEKTVVRLELEYAEAVVRSRSAIALAPRLRLQPVLGYDGAFERASRVLTRELDLVPATSMFDAAMEASGLPPGGVSSKVGLKLARGLRADAAAGAVLARLADIAEANLPGTLDDVDIEFLHDLRVAVRRARSVLRELEGVHPPAEWKRLREQLKRVQAATGPVRDLDVQLLEWDVLTADLPERARGDLTPLLELLGARRARDLRALRRDLQSKRFAEAMAAWRALASLPPAARDDPERPKAALAIDAVAADRIRAVYRRMVRDGAKISQDTPDEALHELRKRGKELRYLLELFGGLFPADVVKPMVTALKGLQDVLGRFQDRAVQAEQLRGLGDELAAKAGGPAALMALGLAIEALLADQQAARDHFAERFARFAAADQRALVKATFPKLS